MAESAVEPFEFSLPLGVKVIPDGRLPTGSLKELSEALVQNLPSLHTHLENRKLKNVHVTDFKHFDQKVFVKFRLTNEKDLVLLKSAADEGTLTYCFTEFAKNQMLHTAVRLPEEKRLRLDLELQMPLYQKAETALKKKADDHRPKKHKPSTKKPNDHEGEIPDPLTVEGSRKDASKPASYAGAVHNQTSQPDGALTVVPTHHQQPCSKWGDNNAVPNISNTFYLYLPSTKHRNILSVQFRSRTKEMRMNTIYNYDGLWEITVSFPPSDIHDFDTYWYDAEVKTVGWVRNNTSFLKVEFNRNLDTNIQRDIMQDVDAIAGVEKHLVHLFNLLTCNDLKDSVVQLEHLLCRHPLHKKSVKSLDDLVINVMQRSYTGSDVSRLLLAVMIGLVLGYRYTPTLSSCLSKSQAKEVLKSLQCIATSALPSSCLNYMPDVCEQLWKTVCGNEFSVLKYILSIFPYLNEAYFCNYLTHHKSFPIYIANEDSADELVEDVCAIFNVVDKKFNDQPSTECKLLLETITRHLPLDVSTKALAHWKSTQKKEHELKKCVIESMTAVVQTKILDSRKKKDYCAMLSIWNLCNFCIDIQKLVEDGFLNMTEQTKSLPRNDLLVVKFIVTVKCELFNTTERQLELLKKFAVSENKELHSMFVEMLKLHPACETVVDNKLICTWYQTALHKFSGYRQDNVVHALSYLSDVCSVEASKMHAEDELLKIALKWFERINLKDILKEAKAVEKELNGRPLIGKKYTDIVSRIIKQKHGKKPDEMINSMCTLGELRVTSSMTASLVCTILDQQKFSSTDNLGAFSSMLSNLEFWKRLLKVNGKDSYIVKENKVFIEGITCLHTMLESLRILDVPCAYVRQLQQDNMILAAKELLDTVTGTSFVEITQLITKAESSFQEEKGKVENVISILKEVKIGLKHENKLPMGFSNIINILERMKSQLQQETLTPRYLKTEHIFWGDLADFPYLCEFLKASVCSKVFWNVSLDIVLKEFQHKITDENVNDKNDDILQDVPSLFGETRSSVTNHETFLDTRILLKVLIETGGKLYRDAWQSLQNDTDKKIVDVIEITRGVNIAQEIKFATHFLKSEIKKDVIDALHRLSTIHEIKYKVHSMKSALEAFGIDPKEDENFHKAVTSFENLLSNDISSCTFVDVSHNLQVVFLVAEKLSSETIDILASLGKSSTLIKFLSEIVDDDIRNLIDAVEDISEQHVRESTVSGLIEVKRFLQALLKVETSLNAETLFSKVSVQTNSLANASSLATKIEDCMDNLHNLKSLYNNVANRGEQTKEIIDHIVKKGTFLFQLENRQVCDFKAKYKQDKKDVIHTNTTLIDLRSRALLLMNTDAKETERRIKGEDLMKFVGFVDACMEISELIQELYVSGHRDYKTFAHKENPSNLCQLETRLKNDLFAWKNILSCVRDTHYLLNFIKGTHIHMLHEYLETGKGKERVRTLLKFIHPDLEIEGLQDVYSSQKEHAVSWSNQTMLNCIGEMLHTAFKKLKFFKRPLYMQTNKKGRLVEVVQKGKLFVATLEENSLLVVKILLAIYGNTMQKLPEPNQVLFCTKETSWEEISLIMQRCLRAQEYYNQSVLFCIANVELISNELQFKLVDCLRNLDKYKKFLLAIICRGSSKHPFLDELSDCAQVVRPITDAHMIKIFQLECPNVCTYTSEVAGLGKTNTIHMSAHSTGKAVKNLHISGPVHKEQLVERLRTLNVKDCHILHVDIGNVDSPLELDMFLFELVLLRFVTAGTVSVNLPTMYISLEISNTMNNILRNSLQTAMAFQREHLVWKSYKDFIVCQEINSPVQVVCHFLQCLQNGNVDKLDIFFNGSGAVKGLSPAICRQLLHKHFSIGTDMSFSILNIFLNVLADQLKKMSCSTFFRTSRIVDMMGHKNKPTVRSSLVQALVEVSREFSSRSVNACRSTQESTMKTAEEISNAPRALSEYTTEGIDSMIRWEESNHLIYVFHNQNIQTISPMYREIGKVPSHIQTLFESQMKRSMDDFQKMDQSQLQSMLQKVARTDPVPISDSKLRVLAQYYALTPDNLLKMVLIMMRVKANIPVIVMGETGCGKTSLVRYLADICDICPFEILSIHAGVEENAILEKVGEVNSKALTDTESEYWLFLDEINTSEHLGLMSNIICHKRCFDKTLAPNLVVMAACNPYKLRTSSAISSAGLQGKVKADELSRLVYRVLPLPEMMVDYVWDFGSLSENDEIAYISRMTEYVFPDEPKCHALLTDLLCASQKFVRENEQMASSVSLRDVQRCRILTEWFLVILTRKKLKCPGKSHCPIDRKHRAIILALAHCYHSRFPKNDVRRDYRKTVAKAFELHSVQVDSEEGIQYVIQEEQKDILLRMELPEGTAQNAALQENVFVILICILNRIPIFLVGKPGCSKSLSMQVIRSNLRGKDSKDEFFKTLPQLYCVSYQGSESSTSDGIIRVFDKAENYQSSNRADEVLSVVILDEIGLAEISRFNPLKVLHNLLEPDGQPRPNVAVVGISNWALDASKMNRAVHLSRPEMDVEELFDTGVSISDSFVRSTGDRFLLTQKQNGFSTLQIKADLHQIAESYVKYIQQLRFKNFHGLRDYYSLVKFISRILATDPEAADSVASKSNIILQGLQRNFGGLPSELATLMELFQISQYTTKHEHIPVMHLIKENVTDKMARHLMLITSGDGVMGILETELNSIGRQDKVIIFGSQFEEDLTDDYNYRILSRIILCMEEGLVLVLKDLESIYGSLYDMLNQNYTVIGKKKNCRVALGHYSNPVCHVNDTFRCVVLVDECQLDHSDPPFLNRFEKQYLKFSDTITHSEQNIIEELNCWIKEITDIREREFTAYDIFPIYSEDMVASLVMKTSHCDDENVKPTKTEIVRKCIEELMWIMKPEAIVRVTKGERKSISTDADRLKERYFNLPLHNGMCGLIAHQMDQVIERDNEIQNGGMTIVFTNSNIHSKVLNKATKMTFQIEKLGSFKSEKQLSTRLKHFWIESNTEVLFLQCSAIDDEKHIMLAKSIVEHLRLDAMKTRYDVRKHVYIVVHLDKSKGDSKTVAQLNFLSDWKLVMLDSIETPMMTLPELCSYKLLETVEKKRPLQGYIQEQLTWAFTRIKYTAQGRDVGSIRQILENLEDCPEFLITLDEVIFDHINRNISEEDENEDWQVKVACDIHALNTSSCFVDALEQHVLDVINVPLSKAVFQLECASAIDCFLLTDSSSTDRRTVWKMMLGNKDVYSIDDIPAETGPECYTCPCENLQLRMPFSRYIFSKIETTKEEFMEYVTYLKGKCDLDADDDLPDGLLKELLLKQDSLILQEVPHMTDLVYTGWIDDYIHDFCNIVSFSASLNLNEDDRISIMRWALEQKTTLTISDPTDLFVALHTTFWVNAALFCADVQLLATCTEVLGKGYKVEQILQATCISDDDSESSLLKATETSDAEIETEQFSTQHGTTNTEPNVSNISQQNDSDSEEPSRNTNESMDDVLEKPTDVCLNPDVKAKSNVSNTIESQADICTEVMFGDTDELNENIENMHGETANQPKDYAEPDKDSPTRHMTGYEVEQILQATCIPDDDSESSLLKATETSDADIETEQFSTQHGTTKTESNVSNISQQNDSDSEEPSRNTNESMDDVLEKPTDVCLNPDVKAKSNVSNTIESQADICTEVMFGDTDELNENIENMHGETANQPKDYAEPDKDSPTRHMTGYEVEQILQATCIPDDDSESSLLKATETSDADIETEQFSTQHGTTKTESNVSNISQQNDSDSEEPSINTNESMDDVCEKPTDVCLNPDVKAKSNVSNTIESQADICTEVMFGDTDELNENIENMHGETANQPKDYAEPDKDSPTRHMTDLNGFDANSDTDIFCPHARLVELVCQKMLPTDKTLAMFANTEIWQRRVTIILTLAGQVSVEPNNLHALRFCIDIAASLVIPHRLDTQFGKLGKALQDKYSLDSKTVFDRVMHIVSCCPSRAQHECQRTLSQYFIRCFSSDPDANSCKFLLEAILQSKLPDDQLHLMKGPFYDALQNELQENETVFDDMMTTESNTSTDGVKNGIPEGDNSDTDDSYDAPKLSPLLCDIDGCLKTLADSEKADSPFSLLLVDILEDIYSAGVKSGFTTKESVMETNNRLLASHQILRGHSFGLKYVSAIAYFKTSIAVLVTLLDKHQCDESKFALPFQTLNVILNPDSNISDRCGLQMFILKSLGTETPACHVKRRFEQVKHQVPFLGDTATRICSESQVKICFDGSPLCIHVPSSVCHLLEFTKHKEEQQQTQCIDNLVEAASGDVSEFLVMHAIAVTHYYLPRSHTDIVDTMKPVATSLVESAKKNKLEPQNVALLERLLGNVDFSVPSLNLSRESSSNETTTASYLVVLYSLLLGQANDTSVFVKVLRNASEAKTFFLPGNPDGDRTRTAHYCNSDTLYINCKCGHRLAIQKYHNLETNIQCVVCEGECTVKKMSDKKGVSTNMATKVHYKHGYHIVIDTDEDFTVRDLSPMAYRILKIITSGTLLGSMALGFSSSKDMEAVTGILEVDGVDMHLLKQIEHHWKMLEVMLNIGHYNVGIFLHAVLLHTRELVCEKATSMSDPKDRLSWEKTFTQHVNDLAGKRFDYMHGLLCKHENLDELDVSVMIDNIHEMNNIAATSMADRNIQLPSLFRLKGQPTAVSFRTELSMRNGNEFPFLKLVLEMTPKLKVLANLLPILRWHLSTVAHASYIMKKHECLDMTVSDFLHHNENEKEKQVIKKNFDVFQRAWNKLEDLLDNKSSKVLRVKQINRSSKVAECLILDESSPVFVVLHELVGIQNTFLDNTLAFASCCKATSFLSREKNVSVIQCIPITEATNQTIIQFHWRDDVLNESQCELSYNKGRHVKYDFENIERHLGATILVNKAYLLLKNSLPLITFSDKLYKNFVSMVNELKEIVPQKPLPQDVVTGIKKKKESSPKLITNLLTNLGVILSLVKKTKGKPDMTLVDYADLWKNMLTRQFPKDTLPNPETSVKLCHLVALHELLEEHNADIVIDSLEKAFRTPLTDNLEQHFTRLVNEHIQVAHNLLRAVKIFAHRCLSFRDADPALSIHEHLSEVSFWPDGSLSGHDVCGADISMVQLLPDSLLVQHVYAMVLLIEGKIEEAQEQEMKVESIHTSWRKQVPVTQPAAKTKKRAARKRRDY